MEGKFWREGRKEGESERMKKGEKVGRVRRERVRKKESRDV